MKRSATVLALLLLLTLVPGAQCLAAPAATVPTSSVAPSDAAFLDTLGAPAAGLEPFDPRPSSTSCTTNADCPTGQLCCYPCGIDGCSNICMNPVKKRCPLFV